MTPGARVDAEQHACPCETGAVSLLRQECSAGLPIQLHLAFALYIHHRFGEERSGDILCCIISKSKAVYFFHTNISEIILKHR